MSFPAVPERSVVSSELELSGPNVIGATGGSGTRALASIVSHGGMFVGTRLNDSHDAVEFGDYSDRWINAFLIQRTPGFPNWVGQVMRGDLAELLAGHVHDLAPGTAWGWKEPRSIFLLPFLHECLPSLRFVHVIRDGRDMALSENQNQLRKHGGAFLGRPVDSASPVDSIELWSRLNLDTARYGEERLGERYLRIRFEDVCRDPGSAAALLFDFFQLRGDPQRAALDVRPPQSLGRWRSEDPSLIAELERAAREALDEFDYAPAGA